MDLVISPAALKQLQAIPAPDAKRLLTALRQVAKLHPQRMSYVTEIVGAAGAYRARKGDYRAVFSVAGNTMTAVAVGHRKEVYE